MCSPGRSTADALSPPDILVAVLVFNIATFSSSNTAAKSFPAVGITSLPSTYMSKEANLAVLLDQKLMEVPLSRVLNL